MALDPDVFADEMTSAFASPEPAACFDDAGDGGPADPEVEETVPHEDFEAEVHKRWPGLLEEVAEFNRKGSADRSQQDRPGPQSPAHDLQPDASDEEDDRRAMSDAEIQALLAGFQSDDGNGPGPTPEEPGEIVTAAEIEAMLGLGGGLDVGVKPIGQDEPSELESAPAEPAADGSAREEGPELELVFGEGDEQGQASSDAAVAAVPAHLAASLLILPLRLVGDTLVVRTPEPVSEEDIRRFRLDTGLYVETEPAPIAEVVAGIRKAYQAEFDPAYRVDEVRPSLWRRLAERWRA